MSGEGDATASGAADGEYVPVHTSPEPSEGSVQAANMTMHATPATPNNFKEREPDIPKFDGKDAKEYRTYKKKVLIWRELTATSVERQALKLLTGLEGEAWTAAEDLDFEALKTGQGPQLLEERLDELMGIQRDSEMMKVIDDFYFAEPRRESEEIRSYLNRMRQALAKLKSFSVEPPSSA